MIACLQWTAPMHPPALDDGCVHKETVNKLIAHFPEETLLLHISCQ
jgi:hypothetical protein